MGVVLWMIVAVFSILVAWLLVHLFSIAFKRWLPFELAVVDGVTLGDSRVPKAQQVFLTVRYHTKEGEGAVRLLFCRSNRAAVERSRRFHRLKDFYQPGTQFRLYRPLIGGRSDFIPECPVLRVETLLLLLAVWCCGGVLVGALIAVLRN
ncbi:MAG TPA: hypothetical protein PKE27_01000 [Povalibacter sp.]|uniref:hypothetical protein n=1 Tax=Povalibacter sp. TaxID=1962978 RepID=UPI002C45043D|nr:hypothetical protein [Povalibacter sp.]HMN43125.1 hypothetical protein [Povalibacter sp.]